MTINLRKLGCAAVGSGLFLGGVYVGTKLTKENITKIIENILYGERDESVPKVSYGRRNYTNYLKEKTNEK